MGVVSSYILSSVSDGILPHLREPVTDVFEDVILHKGLPTQQEVQDLRNRVDMLDYRTREATRLINEISAQLKELRSRS
jgi:hypothetical protein